MVILDRDRRHSNVFSVGSLYAMEIFFTEALTHLIWALAWAIVALRVIVGLFFLGSFLGDFINDFLTITADLFWFLD